MKKIILITTTIALSSNVFAQTDQQIAKELFDQIQQNGFTKAPQNLYIGGPPHGPVRAVVEGKINNNKTFVKFNYGGPGVTLEKVTKDPKKWLKALTVMHKIPGYDEKHSDWFWAKYKPNGKLFKNGAQIRAGKDKGCIACHQSASGNDLTFKHNKTVNADTTKIEEQSKPDKLFVPW